MSRKRRKLQEFEGEEEEEPTNIPQFLPLPHSNENTWETIQGINTDQVKDFESLTKLMKSLSFSEKKMGYHNLRAAIEIIGERKFYIQVLPFIINLLKRSHELLPPNKESGKIPFLRQNENSVIRIRRNAVSCLLAHAFFSTFDFYADTETRKSVWLLQIFNFEMFFNCKSQTKVHHKISMILHYFHRISQEDFAPDSEIIFERKGITKNLRIFRVKKKMSKIEVRSSGLIEQVANSRQCDFANKFIGGATLNHGAAQEEIRFCTNPECLISMLLTPMMLDHEVVVISGTEQFCTYKGYGRTLQFGEDYKDAYVGKYEIVAMDALDFRRKSGIKVQHQFGNKMVGRELWKAYVSFEGGEFDLISGGNWGCGAFKGDKELKLVIQWLAASMAGKKVVYFTFKDQKFTTAAKKFSKFVVREGFTIHQVYLALKGLEKSDVKTGSCFRVLKRLLLK